MTSVELLQCNVPLKFWNSKNTAAIFCHLYWLFLLWSNEPVNGDRAVATVDVSVLARLCQRRSAYSNCRWFSVRHCGLSQHRAHTGTSSEQATDAEVEDSSSQHRTARKLMIFICEKCTKMHSLTQDASKNFLGRRLLKIYTPKSNSWLRPWRR